MPLASARDFVKLAGELYQIEAGTSFETFPGVKMERIIAIQFIFFSILVMSCSPAGNWNPAFKIDNSIINEEKKPLPGTIEWDIPHLEIDHEGWQGPTAEPSISPVVIPSVQPTVIPSASPVVISSPALIPSVSPTVKPSPAVSPTVKPSLVPRVDSESPSAKYKLLWEKERKDGAEWSQYVYSLIERNDILLSGVKDLENYCPRFPKLSKEEKINFWGLVISVIAKYESSFNPTVRFKETSMGIDPVTGQQVYSEGLLQLSYQDKHSYKDCEFDWANDKKMDPKDPRKSIFNPYKNLKCGVSILGSQLKQGSSLTEGNYIYWAVIKRNGRYQKLNEMSKMLKEVNYCWK